VSIPSFDVRRRGGAVKKTKSVMHEVERDTGGVYEQHECNGEISASRRAQRAVGTKVPGISAGPPISPRDSACARWSLRPNTYPAK
jgi:hypothetical protein